MNVLILLVLGLSAVGIILTYRHNRTFYKAFFSGSGILFFCALGCYNVRTTNFIPAQSEWEQERICCRGIVYSWPEEKEHTSQFLVKPVWTDRISLNRNEKFFVNLGKGDSLPAPEPGQEILCSGVLFSAAGPRRPGGFDYAEYLKRQKIRYRLYVPPGNYRYVSAEGNAIRYFPLRLQRKMHRMLRKYLRSDDARKLASAILIGQRELLDDSLQESFARAGIIHLLAVSGLHVGIIYLFITRLLLFLGNSKTGRLLRGGISLLILWLFVAVTGGSPSVLRAGVMFSFLIAGEWGSRDRQPLNAVLASAFLLLLFNPLLLYEVGFQLSYAAVISILLFYPLLEKQVQSRFFIPDRLWKLMSVSLAAQIGTLPISLWYFHRFPVYFLIANLWAVPLTALVLYTGVLLFLLNWMPWVPHLLAAILEGSLTLLHAGTMEMEKLPCLSLYPVFLQKSSVFFLLGILLLVHKGFSEKRTTPLFVSGLLGVLLLGFSLMGEVRDRKRTLLTFYPSRENYCISLYDHGVFYGNTEKEALTPEITGHMLSLSVSPHAYVMLPARQAIKTREYPEQDPWLRVDDYLIFSHNSSMHLPRKTPPRPVDILVFSEYAPPDWKDWLRSLNPQFVLFSRENDRYFTTGNQQTAEPVQLLNIEEEGGLIFRLDGGLRMVKK